jgi:hypothetical protein
MTGDEWKDLGYKGNLRRIARGQIKMIMTDEKYEFKKKLFFENGKHVT